MNKVYPQRVANDITLVLRAAGVAEFPVDVRSVAREISTRKFPKDPITVIKGESLPGFEGALCPAPPGKTGWGIFYNNAISSTGRINFTLGHEFGHYLLHRTIYPKGFQCSTEYMASWESEYGQREHEANVFAATLLMPSDDFRKQIDGKKQPDFEKLSYCADRYEVSLIAATLRWLQYTSRRSMLVVSRDDFILWARSSRTALQSGLYFKTRNRPPIEISKHSLAAQIKTLGTSSAVREFNANIWFPEPCTEHVILSDQYDFTISLLHFGEAEYRSNEIEEPIEDTADQIRSGMIS